MSPAFRMAMACGLACGTLWAAPGPVPEISLDQAVSEALARNVRLTALASVRDALKERPQQAAGFSNPMLTYRGMDATESGRFPDTGEKRFEIEQSLPGYGKRALREETALKDVAVTELELSVQMLEVVRMVREAAFELQAVQEAASVAREEEGVLAGMAKAVEARYVTGETTQGDVIKAGTEITLLKQRLSELDGRKKTLTARLMLLLNRNNDNPLERIVACLVPGGPVPDVKSSVALALTARPEVRAARLKTERGDLQRRLAAREGWPDYRVGLEYRAVERQDDMVMFMVGVELPIWRGKNHAALGEAAKMVSASEAELESVRRQVELEVQEACYRMETARRSVELYERELLSQAAVRVQSSEAGYRAGRGTLSEWLESERFKLDVRTRAAMARSELGTAWAALERAVGRGL